MNLYIRYAIKRLCANVIFNKAKRHKRKKRLKEKFFAKLNEVVWSYNTTYANPSVHTKKLNNNDIGKEALECISFFKENWDKPFSRTIILVQYSFFDGKGVDFFSGGAERYMLDLGKIVEEMGLYPLLIQQSTEDYWVRKQNNLTVFGLKKMIDAPNLLFLNKLVPMKFIYSGFMYLWGDDIPYNSMIISHGIAYDAFPEAPTHKIKQLLQKFNEIVSVDTNTLSCIRTNFREISLKNKLHYVPNYVDAEEYPFSPRLEDGTIRIVFARRLCHERGYWLVSKVMDTFLEKFSQVMIDFVGYAHGDDIREDLLGLQKKYPGRVGHKVMPPECMPTIYREYDISIIPTLYAEGTSLSCLESMSSGCAVVSTNIGGLVNLIIDNFNGLLINPDSEELEDALTKLIEDKELRLKVIRNASAVSKEFSKKSWKEKWTTILEKEIVPRKIILSKEQKSIYFDYNPGWYVFEKMVQRPTQLASALASLGMPYFYRENSFSAEAVDHGCPISGYREITPDLYLTDDINFIFNNKEEMILHLYSTALDISHQNIYREHVENGGIILYEYIDALHDDLHLSGISTEYMKLHQYLIKNKSVIVVATADNLYSEVVNVRSSSKNVYLVTNGVVMEDFAPKDRSQSEIPAKLKEIISLGKPIIGYYGAFASWVDFELIKEAAQKAPEFSFLYIAKDCDGTVQSQNLGIYDNIFLLENVPYQELIELSAYFDVATIPFKVNQVTESTSPVKLFEYMAAQHPIVTTNLPECRKYKSCLIAKNVDEYVAQLRKAIELKNNSDYKAILKKEAQENTWKNKAQEMLSAINAW